MSNFLNFAIGGLTGALSGNPFAALTSSPLQAITGSSSASSASTLTDLIGRDDQMPELGTISSAVNLLQSLGSSAAVANSTASDSQIDLPPLPSMPPPAKPADVPTDDHGQSNIVFSDPDGDGSLIS